MGGGAASGVMGAMIAGHCAQGQWLKSRVKPINPNSTFQHPTRNALRQLAVQWGTLLTGTQRTAWETYAANVTWTNRLGDTVHLSGQMEFIRSNIVRGQAHLPFVLDAPVIFDRGIVGTPPPFSLEAENPQGTVSISGAAPWLDGNVNTAMLVYIGLPRNLGVNFFRRRSRIAAVIRAPAAPIDFSFPLQFGVDAAFGQKWPAWVAVTTADGRLTTPVPLTTVDTGPVPHFVWDEPFDYPDGPLIGNNGWIDPGITFTTGDIVSDNLIIASAGVGTAFDEVDETVFPADWNTPFTLWINLRVDAVADTATSFGIYTGNSMTGAAQYGFNWANGDKALNRLAAVVANPAATGGTSATNVPFTTAANHLMKINYDGATMSIYIDGTLIVQDTNALDGIGQFLWLSIAWNSTDQLTIQRMRLSIP